MRGSGAPLVTTAIVADSRFPFPQSLQKSGNSNREVHRLSRFRNHQTACSCLHGIPVRQGHHFLRRQLPQLLATRADVLSPRMIRIIGDLMADWNYLDERIERLAKDI